MPAHIYGFKVEKNIYIYFSRIREITKTGWLEEQVSDNKKWDWIEEEVSHEQLYKLHEKILNFRQRPLLKFSAGLIHEQYMF